MQTQGSSCAEGASQCSNVDFLQSFASIHEGLRGRGTISLPTLHAFLSMHMSHELSKCFQTARIILNFFSTLCILKDWPLLYHSIATGIAVSILIKKQTKTRHMAQQVQNALHCLLSCQSCWCRYVFWPSPSRCLQLPVPHPPPFTQSFASEGTPLFAKE